MKIETDLAVEEAFDNVGRLTLSLLAWSVMPDEIKFCQKNSITFQCKFILLRCKLQM